MSWITNATSTTAGASGATVQRVNAAAHTATTRRQRPESGDRKRDGGKRDHPATNSRLRRRHRFGSQGRERRETEAGDPEEAGRKAKGTGTGEAGVQVEQQRPRPKGQPERRGGCEGVEQCHAPAVAGDQGYQADGAGQEQQRLRDTARRELAPQQLEGERAVRIDLARGHAAVAHRCVRHLELGQELHRRERGPQYECEDDEREQRRAARGPPCDQLPGHTAGDQ
jgi:hypothetical protein